MILKKIKVKKGNLKYFFIGGMAYNTKFTLESGSKNQYPFTTYYIFKIEDVVEEVRYRSLVYCKLPLICLQFEDYCKCIEFDLPARCGGVEIYPFIGLKETKDCYEIIFKHFPEITVKEKKSAWLGISKKRKIRLPEQGIEFRVREYETKTWQEAVVRFFKKQELNASISGIDNFMKKVKGALFRSYDAMLGTFIQMPWTNTTGFCMDKYSYSLLGFEAIRLNYFSELYEKTGDPDYREWCNALEKLFLNPKLRKKTKYGKVWYNITHFNGKELKGMFYLDVGYAGYPPGQATICYNLGKYLERSENKKLRELLRETLEYILNTQNNDGSWLAAHALKKFPLRRWKVSEGSTAECARALLQGYKLFGEEKYRNAALRALKFLDRENIICRNVLRDIGIDEPEAFSAILVTHAFLDAYEMFGEGKYLKSAENYAYHMLTWHYSHGKMNGFFHPISESITPRISPYESLMAVKLYKRLYEKTGNELWDKISDYLFSKVLEVVDKNYGLSEGIFFTFDGKFSPLPMEQTFATAELLHTCLLYGSYKREILERKPIKIEESEEGITIEDCVKISKNGIKIKGSEFLILFSQPYSLSSKIYTRASNFFRNFGILNSIRDAKYVITGVNPPKRKANLKPVDLSGMKIEKGRGEVILKKELEFHKVKIKIFRAENLKMEIVVRVKAHDLVCNKVIINEKDYTLDTNWTNGGVFRKIIDL